MHYEPLQSALCELTDTTTLRRLGERIEQAFDGKRHGDLPDLFAVLDELPKLPQSPSGLDCAVVRLGAHEACPPASVRQLEATLRRLGPWRKGPFDVYGVHIDSEWRCDLKWQRVSPHIAPLSGRSVLDVGCGNGYYCLRMLGKGARQVLGLEPSPRFVLQFEALRRLMPPLHANVIPLRLEDLPEGLRGFDTVFSMGVLYHRRSPSEHLRDLYQRLAPGGQLVLETLTLPDGPTDVLVPDGRYANMRNVWAIPSKPKLLDWVTRAGFSSPELVLTATTTSEEQRRTTWMPHYSLAEALQTGDPSHTIEGYPAPRRSVVIANRNV